MIPKNELNDIIRKFKGKKALIFSCGYNIKEYSDRFKEFESEEFVKCCWKSSSRFLNEKCDILGISINKTNCEDLATIKCPIIEFGTNYVESSIKIILRENKFFDTFKRFYEKDNKLICEGFKINIYNFIMFLNYIGIKEFYLFGFYNNYTFLNIMNYNYYDDLVIDTGHWYDPEKTRTFEWGGFLEQFISHELGKICKKENIKIFNVSNTGCLSNQIPRITFDNIFTDKKTFINGNYRYIDLKEQLDKNFDKEYYSKKYNIKLDDAITDYIFLGIYLNRNINSQDKKKELILTNNIKNIIYTFVIFANSFSTKQYAIQLFFYHYVKYFDSVFNINFYEDIDFINSKDFIKSYISENNHNIHKFKTTTLFTNLKYKYNTKYKNLREFIESDCFSYLLFNKYKNLPEDFDWEIYINKYPDLKNKLKDEESASYHYVSYGKKEGRLYK